MSLDSLWHSYKGRYNAALRSFIQSICSVDNEDRTEVSMKKATERLHQAIEYNAVHGKRYFGLFVLKAMLELVGEEGMTEQMIHQALTMGCCVHLFYAAILIADDIIDKSELRYSKPCWYQVVGTSAVNDAFLLQESLYRGMKLHFGSEPFYQNVYELFHDASFKTYMGQVLDIQCTEGTADDLDTFTREKFHLVAKYKTGLPMYYFPVAVAFYMLGMDDPALHRAAEDVLIQVGTLDQAIDDYEDCYGNAEATGKIGNDIQEKKCTWLLVEALEKVSCDQRCVMEMMFNSSDDMTKEVKAVYDELNLKDSFFAYERSLYNNIVRSIENLPSAMPRKIFFTFLKEARGLSPHI